MNLSDEFTERRIITAMLTEPDVLAACDNLETRNFTDPCLQTVFAAIRQLQTESADVSILDVDDVLAIRDRTYGTTLREKAGAAFMGELVCECPAYNGEATLWEHDIAWLKRLSKWRNGLEGAA